MSIIISTPTYTHGKSIALIQRLKIRLLKLDICFKMLVVFAILCQMYAHLAAKIQRKGIRSTQFMLKSGKGKCRMPPAKVFFSTFALAFCKTIF